MSLKFSMILEAVDRATAPARKVRASVGGVIGSFRKWGQETRKVSRDIESGARSLEHYQRRARRLRQVALGSFFRAARIQADRFDAALGRMARRLRLTERAGKAAKAGLGWIGGKALSVAKWGAAAAGAFATWSVFDLFKTGGQFEQYQVMLEGTEGSAKKARKAMAWVQKFAQTTPYELDQVMEAFVALKAYGIDPVNGSLKSLGDGSAGMSKPLMQSVEALADAITGEFERLKEFGIRASKAGDKVTFTYRKNGKDIQRTVKATGSEIEKTITGIFSDRFGGGMARQSKTLFGLISNMKDKWSGFQLMIANAGIFDKVKAKLDQWYQRLDALSQNGKLQAWAEAISDKLEQAFDWGMKFVEQTDWKQVGKDLKAIAGAAWTLAKAVAWAIEKIRALGQMRVPPEIWVGLKAAGWVGSLGGDDKPPRRPPSSPPPPSAPAMSQRQRDGLWNKADRSNGSPYRRALKVGPQASGAPAKVGGKLDISVKVDGPGKARVRRVSSDNPDVPISASVGRAMGAPA